MYTSTTGMNIVTNWLSVHDIQFREHIYISVNSINTAMQTMRSHVMNSAQQVNYIHQWM